jgi:hypothetical protein
MVGGTGAFSGTRGEISEVTIIGDHRMSEHAIDHQSQKPSSQLEVAETTPHQGWIPVGHRFGLPLLTKRELLMAEQ